MIVHQGDCLEVLKTLEAESVHAVVTDPPYALGFMGATWDTINSKEFQEWNQKWAEECLRVLKPGGYILAFGATRTFGRLQCAIEDAGFEVRDTISWVYAQGFPKSQDISKQIDKMHGAEREFIRENPNSRHGEYESNLFNREKSGFHQKNPITAPASDEAKQWEGWGTALKPAMELIVMARKPLSEKTVVKNVLKHGTGALNIDACRIPLAGETSPSPERRKAAKKSGNFGEDGATFKDGRTLETYTELRSGEDEGRYPANVAHDGSDEVIRSFPKGETKRIHKGKIPIGYSGDLPDSKGKGIEWEDSTEGRFPANVAHDGSREVIENFPNAKAGGSVDELPEKHMNVYGKYEMVPEFTSYADDGSASRFFYCSKASRAEREAGLDGLEEKDMAMGNGANVAIQKGESYEGRKGGFNSIKKRKNIHPTVKPVSLMRWLVKLVTPPNGTVLDPFTGSGTTGVACQMEGFDFIGIEKELEYIEIANTRIEHARTNPRDFMPLEERKELPPEPEHDNPDQMDLI